MKIDRSIDLKTTKFYAIDIETTGLDFNKDEIISFACVPISNLKILVGTLSIP